MEVVFPPREETPVVPIGLGYESEMIERAMRGDDVAMLRACHDRRWIDHGTRAFNNQNLRLYALHRGALKCEAELARLGFPAPAYATAPREA